ncbi:sensor histidine kinase [Actinomadura rugatobispora]|uniref:histidine kinase n=1 Tax=Actinomadura rugatobispora TaxID=1994 RepID=A0ABW1A1D1_9ACTN|nr:HAMP domain-containing sensor histidine kinase [Actinomadura rugatobispora]
MRLRPRSIRARDTLIAAVLAALVFGSIAAGTDLAVRYATGAELLQETQIAARRVSAGVRDGSLTGPRIPDYTRGRILIQVVAPGGEVIGATPAAAGRPPLSDVWPSRDERIIDRTQCRAVGPGGHCEVLEVIRTTTAPDSVVVYAVKPMPRILVTGLLEALLTLAVLALSALVAKITWRFVGRTLRPVEEIRTQLAEISASDLSRRVPEPPGEDEIAQLARTANETLDRLERAVARQRQFASDASHELRTPIAGLRANLEDASMHPDDTDLERTIASALRDTDRLESIVTDLLLLARIGTGGTAAQETIDLSELAAAELRRRTSSGLAVHTSLDPGVAVRGVRMQLVRLLGNLLDNAERYAGGKVEIEVDSQNGHARLTVTDDGAGVPPEDRERVFERFTRLDSARSRGSGGTGLGLAIAREIAQAHGGSLRIEDHPQGARFALSLPLAP